MLKNGKKRTLPKITGMLSIGNGEKCPYCDKIITKGVDFYDHATEEHQDELLAELFPVKSNAHSEGEGSPKDEMIKRS